MKFDFNKIVSLFMLKTKQNKFLVVLLFALFSQQAIAQNSLPFTESFSSAFSSSFYSSSNIFGNAGATYACTTGNYVAVCTTSNAYITTKSYWVPQGKGLTISFKLKSGGTFTAPDVYIRVADPVTFSYLSATDYNRVKVGTASTNGCGVNTINVPSDVVGGQRVCVTIHFRNTSGTNWIAMEDFSMTEGSAGSVPTTYSETFSSNNWYNGSSYVKIPYHTYNSSSNAYTLLSSGGTGGSFDYYAAFTTGFDVSPSGNTRIITQEVNTSSYSKGELRYSFRSQYPCGGPVSYTFDETYSSYAPKVYIQQGPDNGSNSWVALPVNSYFPNGTWCTAAVDISGYKTSNVKFKFERGGFCNTFYEGVDNIKVFDRDCSISSLTCGAITGTSNPQSNTNYNYSVAATTGATYYKWYVRNDGTLYDASPYIVSGQGTQNVTINFGALASPLRVICIPYDANPGSNADACYAKLGYLAMTSCTAPVIAYADSTKTTTCAGTDGSIKLNGLTANTQYALTYNKNGLPVSSASFTTDANGVLTIAGLSAGSYNNFVVSLSGCSSAAFPATGAITISDPAGSNVATPVFNLGATSSRCGGAGVLTYTATATNNTGIVYSLDVTSVNGGNTINPATGAVTYTSGYTGTAVITATASGCAGPKTATHTVTITAATGTPVFNLGATSTRCQAAGVVTYTATATNSTSITYSLDVTSVNAGNTINANTGEVTFVAGYSGTATITANATGCGTPSSAAHTVTITPTVLAPVFTNGTSVVRCQGAGSVAYTANAANSTGITYTLDVTATNAGNSIVSGTGIVTWSANYTGTATITASAAGCNGPATATLTVTVTAPTGTPVFTLGNTSNRCQGAGTSTYSASATNSTAITYSLDPTSVNAGNTINASTGEVTWAPNYTGTTVVSALAAGCSTPTNATHIITTNGPVATPVFALGSNSSRCQAAEQITYTATAANSTAVTYTLDITATNAGNSINANNGTINWAGNYNGIAIVTATAAGCNGPKSTTLTITVNPQVSIPVFNAGSSSSRCQGVGTNTYTATSANATITYSMNIPALAAGNTIDANTGQVVWVAGYSGTATITATAVGCGTPLNATHTVIVTPSVAAPVFNTSSSSASRCSGPAATVNYGATAANSTGITYSLDAASLTAGNTINSNNGNVTWIANYVGTATITATATGCNGPAVSTLSVLFSSPAGIPVFALGATSSRCQGAASVTYTATSTNSLGVIYRLDATSLNAGNSIDSVTGVVNWMAAYSGTATITAVAIGCGNATSTHTITINPSLGVPVFNTGPTSTRCKGAATVTYAATAANSSGLTYVLDATALTAGNTINANTGAVTWAAGYTGNATITATATGTGCSGGSSTTATHVVTVTDNAVGTPVFTQGATSERCAGASVVTYTATAANSSSITYSLDINSINGGTTINAATGAVNWSAGYNGTSTITATADGCNGPTTATHTVTVVNSVTPTISITANPGNSVCAGVAVTFTAQISNGGSNPIYTWKKNSTTVGDNSSTYTDGALLPGDVITAQLTSDAGCAAQATVTSPAISMTVKPIPSKPIGSVNSPLCEDDALQLNTQQVNGATYTWTGPGGFTSALQNPVIGTATPANSGAYIINVTVNGCTSPNDTLDVLVRAKPAIPEITKTDDTLTSTPAVSYQWYISTQPITGATAQKFVVTESGIYSVLVTDANGCQAKSIQVAIKVTGIDEVGNDTYFTIYPNPALTGTVQLLVSSELIGKEYNIYNVSGQKVHQAYVTQAKQQIDISLLAPGVYFVKAGERVRKLVKE